MGSPHSTELMTIASCSCMAHQSQNFGRPAARDLRRNQPEGLLSLPHDCYAVTTPRP
jgi:hypothetical protein